MTSSTFANHLREALDARRFFITVEFVTPEDTEPFPAAVKPAVELAGQLRHDPRLVGFSVTDRVKSEHDHDPVAVAHAIAEAGGQQPLVHLAGKSRDVADLLRSLDRMRSHGLINTLMITGDRVKSEPSGGGRVRYLESVAAMWAARRAWPELTIAGGICPFKYREEECVNQYLKLGKKMRAGANYAITQIGYDMRKFQELLWWCRHRAYDLPAVANVMPITAPRGRYIRSNRVPGITITDDLQALVEEEAKARDKGRNPALRRLALQIVGLERMGYAGVQLTAIHKWEMLQELLGLVDDFNRRLGDHDAWVAAWTEHTRLRDGRVAQLAPCAPFDLFDGDADRLPAPADRPAPAPRPLEVEPTPREYRAYRWLDAVDHWVFRRDAGAGRIVGRLLARIRPKSRAERLFHRLEHATKRRIVGCETCGACRLPYTSYVCPETCPKGLANGPCGGTHENECEFADRECIHNRKYRVAKRAGTLGDLEEVVIAAVPAARRGSCSWTAHFRGDGAPAVRVVWRGSDRPS